MEKLSKVKKGRVEVKTLPNEHPLNDKTYHGTWHPKKEFQIGNAYGRITVTGMITGCGLGQIHGVTYLRTEDKETFLRNLEPVKQDGIGALIATLGQTFWNNHENILLEMGFERLSEYPNYKHGMDGQYRQRTYILKL